jgi:hypothetical protein
MSPNTGCLRCEDIEVEFVSRCHSRRGLVLQMRTYLEYFRVTMHDKHIFLIFTTKMTHFEFLRRIVDTQINGLPGYISYNLQDEYNTGRVTHFRWCRSTMDEKRQKSSDPGGYIINYRAWAYLLVFLTVIFCNIMAPQAAGSSDSCYVIDRRVYKILRYRNNASHNRLRNMGSRG